MQLQPTSKTFKLMTALVLSFFITQVTGREFAIAAETDRLTAIAVGQMPNFVKAVNDAESIEELWTAPGTQPIAKFVTGSIKAMLYQLVPSNFETVKVATEGACVSGYSWLLKKVAGLNEAEADMVARLSIWSLTNSAKACASKVLKKADQLVYPTLAQFKPDLAWDAASKELNVDHMLGEATFAFNTTNGTIEVPGTAASIKISSLLHATYSPKEFFPTITTLQQQLNTPKTATGLSNLIFPAAWALAPLLLIVLAVLVIILGVWIFVAFSDNQAEYYIDVKNRANTRDAHSLIEEMNDRLTNDRECREALVGNYDIASEKHWTPDENFVVRSQTVAAWEEALTQLAHMSVDDPANANMIIDLIKNQIASRNVNETLLQASYRVVHRLYGATTRDTVRSNAYQLLNELKAKKIGAHSASASQSADAYEYFNG